MRKPPLKTVIFPIFGHKTSHAEKRLSLPENSFSTLKVVYIWLPENLLVSTVYPAYVFVHGTRVRSLDLSESLMSVIILYSDLEESRRILLGSEDEEDEPAVSLQVVQMAFSCFTWPQGGICGLEVLQIAFRWSKWPPFCKHASRR